MTRRSNALRGVALLSALLVSACRPDPPPSAPATADARTSYAIGLHLGMRLQQMRTELDVDEIVAGFAAGIAKDGPSSRAAAGHRAGIAPAALSPMTLDADAIRVELSRLADATRDQSRATRAETARLNQRAGAEFLAANRARPDVVELPSGVQYRIVHAGADPPPSIQDRITVEYEGRLLDGAVFDTSHDRFAPTIVRLQRTPPAWREVVPRVAGGSTVEVWVPGTVESAEHPLGLVPPGELTLFTIRIVAIDRYLKPETARGPP